MISLFILPNIAFAGEAGIWSFALSRGLFSEKKQKGTIIETSPIVGFELARRFSEKIGIGFEFSSGKTVKEALLAPGIKTTYNNHFSMVFLNYRLDGLIRGFYIGPQVGIVFRSRVNLNGNIDLTSGAKGIRIGCGCKLKGSVFFGLQVQYIEVDKAEKISNEGGANVVYVFPQTYFTKYQFSLKYKF